MEYEEFLAHLEISIEQKLDQTYEVRFQTVMKNNDVLLHAVVLMKKGERISPTIYLNAYYDRFKDGESITKLAEEIVALRKSTQSNNSYFKPTEDLSLEKWKDKVVFRLVNRKANEQRLKNLPYMAFVDLAITFHCLVSTEGSSIGSFAVTKELMKRWNVNLNVLYQYASKNTPKIFPVTIRSMEEILEDMVPTLNQDECEVDANAPCIYILSNQSGVNGASALLYPEVLEKFSYSICSNLYILPSSIHEVILVPYHKDIKKSQLMKMVSEVNETEVAKEEVLSSQVYYYDRFAKKLEF